MKGVGLRETSENLRPARDQWGFFRGEMSADLAKGESDIGEKYT